MSDKVYHVELTDEQIECYQRQALDKIGKETIEDIKSEKRVNRKTFLRFKVWEKYFLVQDLGCIHPLTDQRGLWYWLKPALLKFEGFTKEPEEPHLKTPYNRRAMQDLSAVMSDLVLEGDITYDDLLIEDKERLMKIRSWPSYYKDVIVFVEKNTIFRKVESVGELFDITFVSGKGQQATAAIEKMVSRLQNERSYKVVMLTDYDPSGEFIGHKFAVRCEQLGLKVEVIRAGLQPEHVPAERHDLAKYIYKTKGMSKEFLKAWQKRNPMGIYGFELEAFATYMLDDSPMLREVLVDCLLEHCPESVMYDKLLEDAKEETHEHASDEIINDLEEIIRIDEEVDRLREIQDGMREACQKVIYDIAKEKIEDIEDDREIPEGELRKQAIKGNTWLFHSKYTDTSKIQEDLKEKLEEMIEDEDIEFPDLDEVREKLEVDARIRGESE